MGSGGCAGFKLLSMQPETHLQTILWSLYDTVTTHALDVHTSYLCQSDMVYEWLRRAMISNSSRVADLRVLCHMVVDVSG